MFFFPYYMIFFFSFSSKMHDTNFLILYDMCVNLDFTFLHVDLYHLFFFLVFDHYYMFIF